MELISQLCSSYSLTLARPVPPCKMQVTKADPRGCKMSGWGQERYLGSNVLLKQLSAAKTLVDNLCPVWRHKCSHQGKCQPTNDTSLDTDLGSNLHCPLLQVSKYI